MNTSLNSRQTLSGDYISVVNLPDNTTWYKPDIEYKTSDEAANVGLDFQAVVNKPTTATMKMYGYKQDGTSQLKAKVKG